jgi:CDP-glucose 4,6-dehydratase
LGQRLSALEDLEMINAEIWRSRRVLITGHTGFKGGWLSLWLSSLGADVAGYALDPPTKPSLFEAAQVGSALRDHRGDIRDVAAVRSFVEAFDPEVVFHLAAQPILRYGYREPVETYATNVVGTAAVLDACRRATSVRAIVSVTTDKCYENRDWVWGYREIDRLGGFDPYSSSKACAELVTSTFRRSYFETAPTRAGVATARAGNVIGGGDWADDRLIPDLVRAVTTAETAVIRNPGAVRPWQHVLEPLSGYIGLAEHLMSDADAYSGAWNFGPATASFQTVSGVLDWLGKHWEGKLKWSLDTGNHPHEAQRLLLDSSKAQDRLGWSPQLKLEDALRLSVEWYDAYREGRSDMRRVSEAQISWYANLAGA